MKSKERFDFDYTLANSRKLWWNWASPVCARLPQC